MMKRSVPIEALLEAARDINSVLRPADVLRALVSAGLRLTQASGGAAGMMSGNAMVFREYNDRGDCKPVDYRFEAGHGVAGRIIQTFKPYITNDPEHDPYVDQQSRETLGFYNLVNCPILSPLGELLGCFEIHNSLDRRHFDEQDVEVLQALANLASVSLQNAMLLERQSAADQALRESREKFRRLAEATSDFVWEVDARGVYTYCSPRVRDILGYEPRDILGKTPFDLMPSQEARRVAIIFQTHVLNREPLTALENENFHKDGHLVVLETSGVPFFNASGELAGYRGIDRDVTRRKRAEEALRASEEKYRALVETTNTGFVILDAQGQVLDANEEYVRLTGRQNLQEIKGRSVTEWTAGHDQARNHQEVEKCLSQGFVRDLTIDYVNKKGQRIPVEINATAIRTPEGLRIMSLVRDTARRTEAEEALADSRRMLQLVLDSIPVRVFWKDRSGTYLGCNRSFARDAGLEDPQELVGKNDFDMGWREQAELYRRDDREVMESGLPRLNYEEPQTTREGGRSWLQTSKIPLRGADGAICGILGVYEDITSPKRAQEALRESEERFRSIFLNAAGGIAIASPEFRYLQVNPAFCRFLGYSEQELLGLTVQDITHPDDFGLTADAIDKLVAGQAPAQRYEKRYLRKDGEVVWGEASVATVRDAQGKPVYFVAEILDVTARKRADEALRKSEEQFRLVFETSPIGMALCEMDGTIIQANQAYLNIIGYTHEEALKLSYWDVTPKEYEENEAAQLRSMNETGKYGPYEKEYIRKTGQRVPVLLNGMVVTQDGVKRIWSLVSDITERKKAETELRLMAEELKRSNLDLEQFAYVASHDLQEPLRMVSSYMDLLASNYQDRLDKDAQEFIGFAVDGARRMHRLIGDLLAYSRVGTRGRQFGPVAMQTAFDRAVADLSAVIRETGAEITHDVLPEVCGDETQLSQVLLNLIGNAIKFRGQQPPRIHVGAQRREDHWLFSVRDNGIGIPSGDFDRIFLIFQRLHPRRQYPGSGIGLAICKKIVERHGGKISVESQPGQGTTFYFTIPDRPEAAPRQGDPSLAAPA